MDGRCSAGSGPRPRWGRTCARYTWGNVRQLEKAGREFLAELARQAPLLPGADMLAFIDIDSMQKRVYGHHKQGAGFGHTKIQGKSLLVRGLNALAAVDLHAAGGAGDRRHPAARRQRELRPRRRVAGRRGDQRGPGRPGAPARSCSGSTRRTTPPRCSARSAAPGRALLGHRADGPQIRAAIAAIGEDAWTPITLPAGDLGRPAEPAGSPTPRSPRSPYTAFASKKGKAITARLIVRRVKRPEPQSRRRPGRAVPGLALPRRVHRLAVRADYLKP